MEKIKSYVLESYNELTTKVSWPTWAELQETIVIVLIALAMLSLIIYGMDIISSTALHYYYMLF